ncbi:cyclic nucleotide-binding domain-containing protein [Apiospora arundinis]
MLSRSYWKRCPSRVRKQVEDTAKTGIPPADEDVEMVDAQKPDRARTPTTPIKISPQVIFGAPSLPVSPAKDDSDPILSKDPDPFLSVDMENMRNRRRGSFAPPTPLRTLPLRLLPTEFGTAPLMFRRQSNMGSRLLPTRKDHRRRQGYSHGDLRPWSSRDYQRISSCPSSST